MTPEEFQGTIVVVVPVRNEGVEIVRTIRDFRAKKAPGTNLIFSVVDDASEDACCHVLRRAADVALLSQSRPRGQGVARNVAVQQFLDQDVRGFVSIDAHMRISQFGLERLVLDAEQTGGFVCPRLNSLNTDEKRNKWNGHGGTWVWNTKFVPAEGQRKAERAGLWHHWTYRDPSITDGELQPVELLLGACYAFTPTAYRTIGGFQESRGEFGFFEQELALSAWFHGLPCHCNPGVEALHLFRISRPYQQVGVYPYWFNYVECLRTMFEDATFRRVFQPVLEANEPHWKTEGLLQWLLHTPTLDERHAAFAARRKHTDAEALAWLRIDA